MKLTTIFYYVDEFCKQFEAQFNIRILASGKNKIEKPCSLSLSEIMTIAIYYHYSGYKTFKHYYTKCAELRPAFHGLLSYNRFIELKQKIIIPMYVFLQLYTLSECDGVSFIDSFPLRVSHSRRIGSHKTFKKMAARGKTSMGWFYGFKLHIVINGYGQIINFLITPGNVADNNADVIEKLTQRVEGKIYGDKGYILNKNLFEKLYEKGVHIVTKIKKNMKNKLIDLNDKLFLKKRGVVESVGAVFKEDLNIEHSRYRSPGTFLVNVFSALAAYYFREKKPSIYRDGLVYAH